jgi:phosphoribosylglycinamide formyltransferase-1
VRVAVLVSGHGSNLQALLDSVHGREVEIVAVASDRADARALERAAAARVPARVFALTSFDDRAARDAAIAGWLSALGVELVVLAGYMALLTPGFVARFPDRIVNVHPSLLPAFPGIRSIQEAIDRGVKVVGVTVHLVDDGVDTGAILLQRAIDMPDSRDPAVVHAALQVVEHELLPEGVRLLAAGRVKRDPDDPRRVVIDV